MSTGCWTSPTAPGIATAAGQPIQMVCEATEYDAGGDMDLCRHCGQISGSGKFCGNCGIAQAAGALAAPPGSPTSVLWQPLPVGMLLQERYILRRLISRGSFGAVYEVEDHRFGGQRRALKELVPLVLGAQEFAEAKAWFLREGQMLGDLNHPSIPRIWDSFEEQGRLYIVMQYVEGRSLEDYMEAQPGAALPAKQVLEWTHTLCEVLEYLHGHTPPVVFRDLKPANIMLDAGGRLMLIDFGIATRFAPQRIGTTIGTPGYAPPEQYQGLAEPRSDIYALAATLHHLITGRDPTKEPPFSFPHLDPYALRIPPALASAIAASLSFIIAERPASISEFRAALFSRASFRTVHANGKQVIRYDLRHASRVASQGWSPVQRELAEARLPGQIESLRHQVLRQSDAAATDTLFDDPLLLRVQALRHEADRLEGVGHYAKALAALDQALALQAESAELWQLRGRLLRLAGNPGEAIGALRQALRLDPDQQPILSSLGWCLAHAGQHHEALAVLEKALVFDPLDATAWAAKGWSLACLKRLHEALRALEEATGLDPENAEAWRTRGWCLERLGLEGEALRAFKQAQRAG